MNPASSPAYRLFQDLPGALSTAGVALLPLRPRGVDAANAFAPGDYDALLDPAQFPDALRILAATAQRQGASFSLDATATGKVRIYLHAPEQERDIVLEWWTQLELRVAGRLAVIPGGTLVGQARGGRLPDELELLCWLTHLDHRRKDATGTSVEGRLRHYQALATAAAPALLPVLDGLQQPGGITRAAQMAVSRLQELGLLSPTSLVGRWHRIRQRHRRRARRGSLHAARLIALTGADGSGKGTLLDLWRKDGLGPVHAYRFKNMFRHHPAYGWAVWRRRSVLPVGAAKNVIDDVLAGDMACLARQAHPWLRLRGALLGRHLCDRYHHDLLFTGLRGVGEPRLRPEWEEEALRLPLPDWHVHLDAADAVLLARKQELSLAALGCYRDGMVRIVAAAPAPGTTFLNTEQSPEQSLACLRRAAAVLGCRCRWKAQQ